MKGNKLMMFGATFLLSASLISCNKNSNVDPNTVVFWHTFGQDIQVVIEEKIDEFEQIYSDTYGKEVYIDFQYQGGYDEILDKIEKGLAIGNVPTLAVAYPDHVANYLSYEEENRTYVYNLEDFFNDPEIGFTKEECFNPSLLGEEDFVPSFIEEGQQYIKEGTYSLPLMKSSEILLYNEDILNIVMADYDSTITDVNEYMNSISWDEFIDLLRFISKDLNKYGNALKTPLVYDSDANLYISQSFQRDIPYVSLNSGKGSIDFNNTEAKEMVQELKNNYDEGLFLTKGTNDNEYGSEPFKNQECIFTVGSTGGSGYNDPGAAGFNVGVARVPPVSEDSTLQKYVSQGVTLTLLKNNNYSEEVNESRSRIGWQFMKFLTNEMNNIELCLNSNGYAPVRESCYTNEVYASYLEESDFMPRCANVVANEINGNYFNYPVFKGTATARDQVGGLVTQVLLNQKTIDQAFKDAEDIAKMQL